MTTPAAFLLPRALVRDLATQAPSTHEVAGIVSVGPDGRITDMHVEAGPTCVRGGRHLTPCRAPLLERRRRSDILFHTHPVAHRPSSVDLVNGARGGPSVSYVISPKSVWAYWPGPTPWSSLTADERRRTALLWRVSGGLLEALLQAQDAWAIRRMEEIVQPYVTLKYTCPQG